MKVPHNDTGGVVNLTANISSSQPAGGLVTFSINGTNGYTVTAEAIGGVAQTQLNGLPVGVHTITAQYSGDSKTTSSQTAGALHIAITGQSGMTVQASTGGLVHILGVNFTLQ